MKKTRISKILAILLTLVTLMSAFPASALAASWPSVFSSSYCEFIASKNINVYRDSMRKTRGTCSPAKSYNAYAETGDKCRIIEMHYAYLKIQYPTSSGYKTGYVNRYDVISVDFPTNAVKSAGKATTYTKPGGSEYGYVAKNDQTYACGEANGYVAVIYPAKSGSRAYKLGYVKSSDYNNIIAPSGTPTVTAQKTISNGTYYVCSALNTNMRLDCEGGSKDNGGNVLLWTGHNGDNQKLKVTYLDNGYYKLEFVHSNKCLDVAGVSYKSGANVHQWTYGGGNNQQWIIADAGNGYYYIVARHSGKFLDVAGGKSTDGTNVQVYDGNRTNAQKFKFVSASTSNNTSASAQQTSVLSRLDAIANGTLTYDKDTVMKVGAKFSGTRSGEQCKGYARNVFYLCFKITVNSTQPKNQGKNYLLYDTKGVTKVGSVTGMKKPGTNGTDSSQSAIKALFLSARPGDFVQMRRQHTGSHSAIVYSVTDTGVTFLEANAGSTRMLVEKNTYTWAKLCEKNMAMTVYTPTEYKLK